MLFCDAGKNVFTFSLRKREEKKGKNTLTPKYYIQFYASFFVKGFFLIKGKRPNFEQMGILSLKKFEGKLPLSLLISINVLNPECC